MSIEFRCPTCAKKLKTGDDKAGKTAKCPQCATEIIVPATSMPAEDDFGGFPSFDDVEATPGATTPRRSAASESIACPMCGAMNDAAANHCYACGEDLFSAAARQSGSRQAAPFDVGDQLSKGFELFKAEMGVCLAATLVYMLVPGAINFVLGMVFGGAAVAIAGAGGDPVMQNVIQQLSNIPAFFIQVFFDAGYTLFLLNLIRRRPVSVGDVFAGGPYFLSLALNRFILFLITALPLVPAAVPLVLMAISNPQDPTVYVIAMIVLGSIGAVVSIVVYTIVWPHCWVIVDRNPGGLTPLKSSAHLTSGHRMEIALMGLLYWLLTIAGMLACCIGIFFTVPIATLMAGIGYDRLIRAKGLGV